jgi:hypothetical protein
VFFLMSLVSVALASPADNPWPVWRNAAEDVYCDDGPVPVMPNGGEMPLNDRIKIRSAFPPGSEHGGPCSFTVIVKPKTAEPTVLWSAEELLKEKSVGARWVTKSASLITLDTVGVDVTTSRGRRGEWVEIGTWGILDGEIAVRLTVDGVLQYPIYLSSLGSDGCSVSVH